MNTLKKCCALLLLSAVVSRADSGTVDLRSHGSLQLYLEDNWKVGTSEFGDRVLVNLEPRDENTNASATMTITFPEQDRLSTKQKLRTQVEVNSRQYEEGSVERKSVARELNTQAGYGFYCSFTDPELIGKPPQKGNYKMISVGLIHVAADVLVEFSISSDDYRGKPYQQVLGALEGMEYKRRGLVLVSPRTLAGSPDLLRWTQKENAAAPAGAFVLASKAWERRNVLERNPSNVLPSHL